MEFIGSVFFGSGSQKYCRTRWKRSKPVLMVELEGWTKSGKLGGQKVAIASVESPASG